LTTAAAIGALLIAAHAIRPRSTTSRAVTRRLGAGLTAAAAVVTVPLLFAGSSGAANSPAVPLATTAEYAVLAGSTVTNDGGSVLDGSLGLSPGTSVTGFPPGIVLPPGTQNVTNAAAAQAQSDLTIAYDNAAGRSIDATTTADLGGLLLQAGVYAGPSHGALGLTGPLVLDGAGDPTSVFIFQTNSSLITETGSTVSLINGAQACNVFWQVGSSATLGTGSVFVGNILALTSIDISANVTVEGRAMARNAAVTLIDDTFIQVGCDTTTPTTASASGGTSTTTEGPGGSTSTTAPAATTGQSGGGPPITTAQIGGPPTTTAQIGGPPTTMAQIGGPPTTARIGGPPVTTPGMTTGGLAQTGSNTDVPLLLAVLCFTLGAIAMRLGRDLDRSAPTS
jgi:hypothetical protein